MTFRPWRPRPKRLRRRPWPGSSGWPAPSWKGKPPFPCRRPWRRPFGPKSLWPLHDLFQRFALDPGFDRQGELFARVPLEGEGWDHFLLGVRLDGNWVTGAGYCVPAAYGDPPQGV